ncbi:DUF421 domain-containing protein [Pontibacter sp. SGAir0037]|uniref:DUF421 domain-containing protein n=1 Tax=Pontibacter sp. SGAir0037 TaxID=2571030 RepID=UPI0010CCE3A3|nr:YetF domain-containing protein [Pontibacter sp. SGAir0037]QCR21880.1 hypothetical protein C1N53_05700 [Pontibacter sp. SGAir0037]
MKKEDIHLSDWKRILIGDAPWEFTIEVFIRTLVIFLLLVIVLRLLGKRMSAQLTLTEMAIMLVLGAIVSVPMQIPERGIIPTVLALFFTLLFQRGWNYLAFKNQKIEFLTQGKESLVVKDGRLLLDEMQKSSTTREQLFSELRRMDVQHLGQVKRVYQEAYGMFSLYKKADPCIGLSILPEQDKKLWDEEKKIEGHFACFRCGHTVESDNKPDQECKFCGANRWVETIGKLEEETT